MISYRRSDSAGITGRIFDRLVTAFGRDRVFMDVDAIPLGVDYREHIERCMKAMDVLLVIIGPYWLGSVTDGANRLSAPDDPARIEIELASRSTQIDVLPESCRHIVYLNAATVSSGISSIISAA
jgi:hypothetical protein